MSGSRIDTDVTLGGRYRMIRRIAVGGMGSVWEAEDSTLHRRVAVKVLSDALASDDRFLERFRREARASAGLSHPNVTPVFDYGEDGYAAFIVMELVEGENLAARLSREGRMDPGEAARIASGIAAALQAAHDSGIVHRDVKPGNVMLTRTGEVRVMDFGIAAAAWATPLTGSGSTMGTAMYISPEQAQGRRATPASDVYALGVVLYEMLTGRPPFEGETPVATASAHVNDPPTPIRRLVPSVPPELAAASERALAKDPAERPASAAAFAALLGDGAAPAGTRDPRAGERTEVLERPQRTAVLPIPVQPAGAPPAAVPPAAVPPAAVPPGAPQTAQLPVGSPPPGRGRGWIVWVLLAILVAAALVAIALAASRDHSAPPPPPPARSSSPPAAVQQVTVPVVAGLSKGDAEKALDDRGLRAQIRDVPGNEDVVLRSDPQAGARVDPGSTVTLFVGSGQRPGEDHGHKRRGTGKGGD